MLLTKAAYHTIELTLKGNTFPAYKIDKSYTRGRLEHLKPNDVFGRKKCNDKVLK